MSAESATGGPAHHAQVDLVSSTPKRVLIVVANPGVSTTLGWPVGFWAAELTHPYYELTERGVEVTIASPDGGRVEFDAYSDPRDDVAAGPSEDLITMGFINTPELHGAAREHREARRPRPRRLRRADDRRRAVADVQLPRRRRRSRARSRTSTRRRSPRPRYCHGTAALVDVKLSDGSYLVDGQDGHRLRQRGGGLRRRARRAADHALARSRTPCASAAPTTSMAACSRRSPCATAG